MPRSRLLPVVVAVLSIAWVAYLWWGHWGDASRAVWIGSGLALTGAVLGAVIAPARARVHAVIAAAMMLSLAAFASTRVIGCWPFAWDALPDARYAAFLTIMGVTVSIGLVRSAFWARWAALAFCAGSALGGTLNSIHMRGQRDETAWLAAIGVIGGATICSQLLRPSVREQFARNAQHAVWASRDRLVRSARWAAISNFAAAPMLLLYAFGQPVAQQTAISALVLAPVLMIGSALIVTRRAAGVVILGVGGLALLGHTVATFLLVTVASTGIAGYYAAFWLPAALLGVIAGSVAVWRSR